MDGLPSKQQNLLRICSFGGATFFVPASPILLAAGAGLRLSGSNSAFLDAEDHGDGGDCVLILAWRTR